MNEFIPLFLGATLSFIGSLPPGIISMTVVENTIQNGLRAGIWLAFGAAVVEGCQALFALQCTGFLSNEDTKLAIQITAIFLFTGLGIYSFYLARKGSSSTMSSQLKLSYFWKGVVISLLNLLAIPYWLVNGAYLDSLDLLVQNHIWIACFCVGVALGTFLLLLLYASLSQRIRTNITQVNKWTNIFLGILFIGLAGSQVWQLYNLG